MLLFGPGFGADISRKQGFIKLRYISMRHITYGLRPPTRWDFAGPVVEDNETLISSYLAWKSSYTVSAAYRYKQWILRFQQFTNKAPEALTIGDWTAFALSLQGRYAPKCVEYALNVVHNYLRFWHEQGRLRLPLYLVRVRHARAKSHNAITEPEYAKFLSVLVTPEHLRNRAIVMLLHDTGMRVSELAKLQVEQIEPDKSAVINTAKTLHKRRVFWNESTDDVLQRYLAERVNSGPDSDWLFPGDKPGCHLTTRSIERIVDDAWRAAKIERRLTPHSFRHGFIHRLAALGVPDAVIAQLVGHSTPHTIAHYTKLSRPEAEGFARKQFSELALAA